MDALPRGVARYDPGGGDVALRPLLAEALRDEGYHVERASSPTEARALLQTHGPDAFALVLSDAFASATDPYHWLDQVRGLTRGAVVISSGWPAGLYAEHAVHGVAALLAKPFGLDDLLAVVFATAGCP
jgi:CheY-like chemotaxis protein